MFGHNINRDSRARERAVGNVKKALMLATDRRTNVYWDYAQGLAFVGDEIVAKWNGEFKPTMFSGEGTNIRDKYKEFIADGNREEGDFSE